MKTGLVIEGGSLRSAFSFGVLKTWADAGVRFSFTAAVGLGGLAAAYFRAGQSDALEEAYGNYFEATGEIGRLQALKGERAIDGAAFLDTVLEKEHSPPQAARCATPRRAPIMATACSGRWNVSAKRSICVNFCALGSLCLALANRCSSWSAAITTAASPNRCLCRPPSMLAVIAW